EVIIVDDNSPDKTAEIAKALVGKYPVQVLVRTGERGLATAVMAGFDISNAKACLVMDADGSHPVEKLPDMIRPLLHDRADITVGSRNIKGGSADKWPWHRRLISKTAAKMSFGLTRMTDPTSGFMGIQRHLLNGLELNPIGYKIVLEIVVKSAPERLVEVPITFRDRELGESKMSLKEQWKYIRHLKRLYLYKFPTIWELIRFSLVGLSGVFVDMAIVIGLKELFQLDTRLCAVFGFLVAVMTNYLLNRYWTFQQGRNMPFLKSCIMFVSVCCIGLMVRLLVMHLFIEYARLDTGNWYMLTNFIGIMVATAVNFSGSKYFAFSPERLAFQPKGSSQAQTRR
ncbi:MAG: glycosyltransferase family 2 protein, partial [Deltaproteobacteria bacterium]|nr:glycosyltransferase family 2 protein [Deltaproteobacteria bacterium]